MKETQEHRPFRRIGVFGLGRFGFGLSVWLSELGAEVLAVDAERGRVEEIDQRVSRAICLDVTNEFAMSKVDVMSLDLVIVCIGRNIQSSLLATAVLRKLGAKTIWVRAIDQSQAEILEAIGVDRIISLEKEMARQVAQNITMPGTRIIAPITVNHSLAEVQARPSFVGKSLGEMDLRQQYGTSEHPEAQTGGKK
jgi:trk system potassium uptake protein TrkA